MGRINVIITRATVPNTNAAFGTALLLINSEHAYKEYANLAAVQVDFATTTDVYKIARDYFGQDLKPSKLSIAGAAYTEETNVTDETLTLVSGNTYSFANQGIKVGSITGLENGGTPIPESDVESINYVTSEITFATSKTTVTADYTYFNDPSALTTLLTTLVTERRDFYAIMLESDNYRAQKAVNDWNTSEDKLPAFRTTLSYDEYPVNIDKAIRPYLHNTDDEFLEAAVLGRCLTRDPGSLTWNYQVIDGITPQSYTEAQETALTTARYNTLIRQFGSIATFNGFYGDDLFIDQKRSQDFMENSIVNAIGTLLITNDKVSYDDRGITLFVGAVDKVFLEAYEQGIIASKADGKTPDYVISSNSRAQIAADNPTQITERNLGTITFKYVEAGAIEGADPVEGEIVLSI